MFITKDATEHIKGQTTTMSIAKDTTEANCSKHVADSPTELRKHCETGCKVYEYQGEVNSMQVESTGRVANKQMFVREFIDSQLPVYKYSPWKL